MKIAIIDRGNKIPAAKYGGTERVIWGLGYELSRLGHEVVFVVPEGSHCDFAQVIIYTPEVEIEKLIPANTDFVHFNFVPQNTLEIPYLITMHGNPSEHEVLPINTIFVSGNHAKRYGADAFVHNGLLWQEFGEIDLTQKREYLHFLGKASWKVKNVAQAAEIAVKAHAHLKIMGGKRWNFSMLKRNPYYLLNPKADFLGMVDDQSKKKIMQKSKGLIFPILWDEPFGLAIIESMYAGCPVFGTRRGSLPELVNDEVGFLSDSIYELTAAILHNEYDPETCHLYAKENFNAEVMTDKYLEYYNKVMAGEKINISNPQLVKNDR